MSASTKLERLPQALLFGVVTAVLVGLVPAGARAAAVTSCGWPVKSDPDLVNIAYPDQSATYWATPFTVAPGTQMTISGHFPLARYMSFHLYEGSFAVDHLTDAAIVPDRGTNPYLAGNRRTSKGTYTIDVAAGPVPAHRAPNTLYAVGLNGEPNLAGVIIYRLYLPSRDGTGGVPLPTVRYTSTSGASILPCPDTSAVDGGSLNQTIAGESFPADWPSVLPSASSPPAWAISHSGSSPTSAGPLTVQTGNPFFANFDNVYLSLTAYRDRGTVVAFRAKAPTFVQTAGAKKMPAAQLRYWSVCTNDFPTNRYVACIPDQAMKLDSAGYFTVVISDVAHKPSDLRATDNWIPAGPYPDTFVLYRQMLPDPAFAQAVAFAPDAASAPKTMGPYFPATEVCTTAAFEQNRCGL